MGPDVASEEPEPLFQDRARASSFGANAELYDRSRPRYPDALIDDLVLDRPSRVLDVGCGTGLLGRSFVERGTPVLGVEPDAQMAEVARRHGLEVEVATFEAWDPGSRRFALLVSGQAWHWVDPELGARRAAQAVAPGGAVVLAWNIGEVDERLGARLNALYDELAPGRARPLISHRRDPHGKPMPSEVALVATGSFGAPAYAEYPFDQRYTTEEWLTQLETHSDHALMAPDERARLLAAVGRVLEDEGGGLSLHYTCEVSRFART